MKDFGPTVYYNASVNTEIAQYFQSHRTTDEGFNSKDN